MTPKTEPGRTMRKLQGFTLIELMIVIVILGILASFVVPKVMERPEEARIAKAKSDIRAIENALDMYKLDNYQYPSTEQGLQALVEKPDGADNWQEGGYVKRLPKDPWKNEYQYMKPGKHGEIDVYSLGPDQQPSEDDIGNWNLQ